MSGEEPEIQYKKIEPQLVCYRRFNLKERAEIPAAFQELAKAIPVSVIAGAPYCILQYFSSYPEGYEAEVGFPVNQPFENDRIKCKTTTRMEVLSILHAGPPETVRETKLKLQKYTGDHALISDEFTREVYPDWDKPDGAIEAQFVIHNWNARFAGNLERVLGKGKCNHVMQRVEAIGLESTPEERFQWAKGAIERLEGLADDFQRYDVVSACAHVFPPGQLEMLRRVFVEARTNLADPLEAVDAVLAFMASDPGWGEKGAHRDDHILYHTKNPADPEGYESAKTAGEKRAAYCFCPIIRARLDAGMPVTYCYCGAGWYRQQWETATGMPVRVEVIRSVLKGDDVCSFAVHLADDI
jgi:effector-binding domain-containing protein